MKIFVENTCAWGSVWSACLWLPAWLVCGAVLACLCRVFRAPPGSGRGVALGGCPLAACVWCFTGQCITIGLSCGGTVCCWVLCSGRLGMGIGGCMVARLGVCSGGSAWAGVVDAVRGLGWCLWWVDCTFLHPLLFFLSSFEFVDY